MLRRYDADKVHVLGIMLNDVIDYLMSESLWRSADQLGDIKAWLLGYKEFMSTETFFTKLSKRVNEYQRYTKSVTPHKTRANAMGMCVSLCVWVGGC